MPDNHLPRQESIMDPILREGLFKGNSEGNCAFRKKLFELLGECGTEIDTSEYDNDGLYVGPQRECHDDQDSQRYQV